MKQDLHYSRDMSEVAEFLPLGDMRKLLAQENYPTHAITELSMLLGELHAKTKDFGELS